MKIYGGSGDRTGKNEKEEGKLYVTKCREQVIITFPWFPHLCGGW
jgi:hypothetical protein